MSDEFEEGEGGENFSEPPMFFPYDGHGVEREPESPVELVPVQVEGIYGREGDGQIIHFVRLTDRERFLSIMIGGFEANAIQLIIGRRRPDRPMTHDLVKTILDRLDATLDRVVIDDLWNGVYYAKLYIRSGTTESEIDARPSDAIALAVRFQAPIYVADQIMEASIDE